MNFTIWAVASGQIYANSPAASTETRPECVEVSDRSVKPEPADLREPHALFNVLVAAFALWCCSGDAKQAVCVGAVFV